MLPPTEEPNDFVMERFGKLAEMDRSFDIAYWQRLGSKAIFETAWQMVVEAEMQKQKGNTGDLMRMGICRQVQPAAVQGGGARIRAFVELAC
jgi:hypothetical protein